MTLLLALGFYALGAISMALFMVLMMAWHCARRPKPPALHHRKNRDAAERRLSREVGERGIDYKFLGMGDREDVR